MKWLDLIAAAVGGGAPISNAAFGAENVAADTKGSKPMYLDADGNDVTKDALKHGTTNKYVAPSFGQRLFDKSGAARTDELNTQYIDAAPAAARDFAIKKQEALDIIKKGLEAHTGKPANDADAQGVLGQFGLSATGSGVSGDRLNANTEASASAKLGTPALVASNLNYATRNANDLQYQNYMRGIPGMQSKALASGLTLEDRMNMGNLANSDVSLGANRARSLYDTANLNARMPNIPQAAATENAQNIEQQLRSNASIPNIPATEAAKLAVANNAGAQAGADQSLIPLVTNARGAQAANDIVRMQNPSFGTPAKTGPQIQLGTNGLPVAVQGMRNPYVYNPEMVKMQNAQDMMGGGGATNAFALGPNGMGVQGLQKRPDANIVPSGPSLVPGYTSQPLANIPQGVAGLQGATNTPALYQNLLQRSMGSQQAQQQLPQGVQGGRVSIMGQQLGDIGDEVKDNLYKDLSNREKNHYLHLTDAEKQWLQRYRTEKHLTDILPEPSTSGTLQSD